MPSAGAGLLATPERCCPFLALSCRLPQAFNRLAVSDRSGEMAAAILGFQQVFHRSCGLRVGCKVGDMLSQRAGNGFDLPTDL
jgi:hypothetical protein